jgi:hypothetical protein
VTATKRKRPPDEFSSGGRTWQRFCRAAQR